jgi:hypothetical protein
LPALIIGPLLACCVASSSASARTKSPAKVTQVIEFELRVLGSADTSREFVVPIEGKISGWTELFDEPQFCRLQSNSMSDERLNLQIRCFTRSRGQVGQDVTFEFETTRALAVGEATVIGELENREGQRLQVIATRR